jgi:hypothetical protein
LFWFCLVEDFWATPESVTPNVGFKKADDKLLAQSKTEVHNVTGKRKRNKKQLKLANADLLGNTTETTPGCFNGFKVLD